MKTITVLKDKTLSEVDLGVDLEVVGVDLEDAMRVVVVVSEADAVVTGVGVGTMMVIGVGVGATMVIRVDVGATVVIGVVAEVAVVLGAVVVVVEVAAEVSIAEVVSMAENLGAETIEIAMDQENRGETMRTVIEEVLRVVLIKESLSISRHHLKIKKSLLMINTK